MAANTADIYRSSSGPPATPATSGVAIDLVPWGSHNTSVIMYTHVMTCANTVDVRDDYTISSGAFGPGADKVLIPNKTTGTEYRVLLVRQNGPTSKHVLLCRVPGSAVPWPTDSV